MIDILRVKDCTEVFTDPEKITETYRDLVKIYHPDSPTGSSDKMIKLQELYLHAKNMKKSGRYMKTDQLIFFKYGTNEKEVFQIKDKFSWSLGDVYKCGKTIIYTTTKENSDVLKLFNTKRSGFRYPDDDTKLIYEQLIPINYSFGSYSTIDVDNENCVIIKSEFENLVNLNQLLEVKNSLPNNEQNSYFSFLETIITELYNLECFLHFNEISHNALLLENFFINYKTNKIHLFGGWCFSTKYGTKLKSIPKRVLHLLTEKEKTEKTIRDHYFSSKMIKLIIRMLYGDVSCSSIIGNKYIKESIKRWIITDNEKSFRTPYDELKGWLEAKDGKNTSTPKPVPKPIHEDSSGLSEAEKRILVSLLEKKIDDVSKCAFLNTEKFLRDQIFSHDTKTRKLKRISDLDPDTFLSIKDPSKHC